MGRAIRGRIKRERREVINTLVGDEVTVDVQYEGLPRHVRMIGVLQADSGRYHLRGSAIDIPVESIFNVDLERREIDLKFTPYLLKPHRLHYWHDLVASKQHLPGAQLQWRVA